MTRINTNVSSLVAQNRLNRTNNDLNTSLTRLSTGLRINTGKDDPAGLIASEALRSDITSINKAITNTQRASQIIATADSALGQVSTLLNDIRGLVVEAANSGALSDDEIAANQLQVDSSLQAINRIAQTTTFQGRKLLDGSLDFITSAGTNFTSIRDLQINQANLGSAGQVALDVEITSAATRARVDVANIPAAGVEGTGALTLTNNAPDVEASATVTGTTSGASFDIAVNDGTTLDGVAGNDVVVNLSAGPTAATSQAASGLYALTAGDFNISAKAGGAYDGALGNAVTLTVQEGTTATAQASTAGIDVNGVTGAFTISALAGGVEDGSQGNDLTIDFTLGANAGSVAAAATYNGAGNSLTIQIDNSAGSVSLADIEAALLADGAFNDKFEIDVGSNGTTLFRTGAGAGNNDAQTGITLSGGASEAAQASLDLSTPSAPALTITIDADNGAQSFDDIIAALATQSDFDEFVFNVGLDGEYDPATDSGNIGAETFSGGANEAATVSYLDGVIDITVDDVTDRTAADIIASLNADTAFAALFTASNSAGTFLADGTDDLTGQAFTGGTDTTLDDVLTITGPSGEKNNGTVTFTQSSLVTTPTAEVDEDGNLTISVSDSTATTLSAIKGAIDSLNGYSAEVTATAGDASFNPLADSIVATDISGATDGGIVKDAVFELVGKNGSQVFEVSAGTTIDQLVSQINLVKEATGIQATANASTLEIRSLAYGENAVVDLRIIEEDSDGTFTSEIGVRSRDIGADVVAKINGVDASGDGNTLKVKNSTLDIELKVEEGFSGNITFSINGGGANFQLGPEVVSNQQARIGINSLSTGRLGGVSGKLFQLAEGGSASLAQNTTLASEIVDEAINQVTSLRGRLGAFQATALESNLVSLNDTVANLTEAESSIRDADFAAESARLTRAQILVQSGTSVLGIANQNPQNVLALLR